MQNTFEQPVLTDIKYTKQGKEVTGPFQNLGVKLTSPNTNLQRGQKTTLEVVVSGQGSQQGVSVHLGNDTPGIVSISGGDDQDFTIPKDVQGTYTQNFTVTANQAGDWGATATVSCVGAGGPSGPIAAGPRATATPIVVVALGTPTPTPTPGGHPPTPTPTASPSPCAPAPTPTTYFVKNLGPLSESDSFKACRATGVNKAGNVIGVCSPSYFGSSGGSWHAFRTEPGAVIDKEKDELGFPAGTKGGYSFATGINAAGHVVGFWGPGGGVGSEFKAFWHDGSKKSKMISLHPDKSKFTTSKAFAVNSSDDVVGAAYGPTIGPVGLGVTFDGHAVIWPGMDPKSMKDLNDGLDDSVKKDWILKAAFGINDDGDIVGRAYNKKLKKYHAFLLKGMKFIDLGALKEDVSDSSAAYAINECGEKVPAIDKVVGYTLDSPTCPAGHCGFVWTAASGLTDMGTLPPYYSLSFIPYLPESYAQAINKKGEVVGASSPAFHTSFFEGDGPGLPGGLCVPASHAIWYNGSELKEGGDLKDLNKLIPGSPGWELDLANGINDDGLIAGSGYYMCFTKAGGTPPTPGLALAEGFSKTSRAVLLIPAGFKPSASALGLKPTAPAPGPGPTSSSTACPLSVPSGAYIFDNWNICTVKNGPTKETTFTLDGAYLITFIATYHWNYGHGALPGGKGISLKASDGTVYGPWPVTTSPGSGGALNVNWECHPGITLPVGTYTVIDPDPATWSQNDASGNLGFVRVAGKK
jgi:probable HAF family extracellular repeat protein